MAAKLEKIAYKILKAMNKVAQIDKSGKTYKPGKIDKSAQSNEGPIDRSQLWQIITQSRSR
jgi:hypothetical protein